MPRLLRALPATLALLPSCGAQPSAVGRTPTDPAPTAAIATEAPSPLAVVSTEPTAPRLPAAIEGRVEHWMRTLRTRTACEAFDYFPNGGIHTLWCHRPEEVTLASLRALANVDVFVSGPHGDALTLDARAAFGHYNPAFVRFLVAELAPAARGGVSQLTAQPHYDRALRPLAEVLWKTHVKLEREKSCFAREKTAYEDGITKKTLPKGYYERWFFFMNPYYCDRTARGLKGDEFYYDNGFDAGVSGNVAKSAVGFWLRRTMDGTRDTFVEGLKKVLATYQPELLDAGSRTPDGAAIATALDAALKATQKCRSRSAPAASASVDVIVTAAGKATARVALAAAQGTEVASCVEGQFATVSVPGWDGADLTFRRQVALR